MEENETISEGFKRELEQASTNTILDPAYKKKKLVLWAIRNVISVVLYVIFWNYSSWVQFSLYFTVPLSLLSLLAILAMPYFLKRKIARAKLRILEIESQLGELTEEEIIIVEGNG
jgi:hypothetical protein